MIITGAQGQPSAGIITPGGSGASGAAAGGGMSAGAFSAGALGIGAVGSILSGLFGYMAGENAQAIYESRARMIRSEAENDALRYEEQVGRFKATQKLSYLKAGVQLSGSPLDVLDETIRSGHERANAIRAEGASRALDAQMGGQQAATSGRNALVSGITGAARSVTAGAYELYSNKETGKPRKDTPTGY